MAKKISDLAAAATLDGTELSETVQGGVNVKFPLGAVTPPGHIDGLQMQWVSGSAVTVGSGAAYIAGLGRVLRVSNAIALTGLVLTASTWYHLYLYLNNGAPAVECVTTSPTAYNGVAAQKNGDASRRYLGSVRTDGNGNINQFQHDAKASVVTYLGADYAQRNLLKNGQATTVTTVSCQSIIPVTAFAVDILLTNTSTNAAFATSNSQAALPLGSSTGHSYFGYANANNGLGVPNHPVDSNQQFTYMFLSATNGSGYIDLNAYHFGR